MDHIVIYDDNQAIEHAISSAKKLDTVQEIVVRCKCKGSSGRCGSFAIRKAAAVQVDAAANDLSIYLWIIRSNNV